jgi:signal transduction histidine kinase/ActR/RegA family two-component response regulator
MAAGADDYIVKPFTAQQLLAQVNAQLTLRRVRRRNAQERELLLASERKAKLDAEAANRAKDEFLAMLGHELRNPLAPISTAIQLMRLRGAPVPELATLERQTAHLTRLVDDLLDVSRITRGKIELRRSTLEIGDTVLRAMEMASPLLEPRAHRVNIEGVPRRGLSVHGDPERLAQAVFNLLSNAAKYSEARSAITVRAWRDTDRVRLSVKDEGAGIAPEMIERVFDMFVQQDQTIERSQGGLGLGLTIVRSLVEMHGGRVTVRSDGLGRGSEFVIDLPCAPVVLPLALPERPLARPDTGPAQRFLIIDDNVDAAMALGELLRLLGHHVEVAHDGLNALAVARRFRPDIALVDIGLPVMDGYELAGHLREQYPELRIIAVTGYGLERDRERSARTGFSDHLVKPIELATLTRLLVASIPERPTSGADQPSL